MPMKSFYKEKLDKAAMMVIFLKIATFPVLVKSMTWT